MRTTLHIDDDVYDDARVIALHEGRSSGAVISELARRALRPVGIGIRDGRPVFDVDADVPQFGAEDVARALEQE